MLESEKKYLASFKFTFPILGCNLMPTNPRTYPEAHLQQSAYNSKISNSTSAVQSGQVTPPPPPYKRWLISPRNKTHRQLTRHTTVPVEVVINDMSTTHRTILTLNIHMLVSIAVGALRYFSYFNFWQVMGTWVSLGVFLNAKSRC